MPMFKCNVEVRLLRPVRGADGSVDHTETVTPALFVECRSLGKPDDAALREESEFLFPPPAEPLPGDLARCGGVEYELASVRVCRDLDGEVVCRRAMVAK